MGYPTGRRDFIETGFNDRANHPMLLRELEATIPVAARQGVPSIIAMFGNRGGKGDAEAIESYFAHELKPIRYPLTSLREAVAVCRV